MFTNAHGQHAATLILSKTAHRTDQLKLWVPLFTRIPQAKSTSYRALEHNYYWQVALGDVLRPGINGSRLRLAYAKKRPTRTKVADSQAITDEFIKIIEYFQGNTRFRVAAYGTGRLIGVQPSSGHTRSRRNRPEYQPMAHTRLPAANKCRVTVMVIRRTQKTRSAAPESSPQAHIPPAAASDDCPVDPKMDPAGATYAEKSQRFAQQLAPR